MPKSRNQSPARSVGIGTPNTQRSSKYTLRKIKMSRSVGSPGQNTSLKLSTVVSRLKENDIPSFNLSVDSVLSDNTQIEQPKRRSWWKRVQDTSRSVLEILENNKINDREVNDIIQEYVDVDVLSQEKRNQTFDLPDSSDNDSYRSIIVPQRKLFSQQQRLTSKVNYKQLQSQRESLESNKTVIDVKEISVSRRKLLNHGTRRTKLEFPAALLNLSANKSANNKTKELPNVEIKTQTRNLFGNKEATKRKNIFANFVLSDSEDEMPEVQPRIFAFKKPSQSNRRNSWKLQSSPASSTTTDLEMDEWTHLPSSTMVEHQLEAMVTSPVKRARLSKLSEEKDSHTISNKSKPSNRSLRSNTSRQSNKNDSKINEENNSKNQLSKGSRRCNTSYKNEPNGEINIKNINNNERGTEINKLTSIDQIDVPENNNDDNHEEVSSDNVSLQYVEEQVDEDVEEEVCGEKELESEEEINNDEDEEEECDEKELESEEETNNVDEVEDNQSSIEENEDEQEIGNDLDDLEEMEHVSQHEIDQIEGDEDENVEKNNHTDYANDENEGNNLNENEPEINKEIDDTEEKEEHQISHPKETNEQNEEDREIHDEIVEREEMRNLQQDAEDEPIDRDDGDNVIEEDQETNKEIKHMKALEKRAGDEINETSEEDNEPSQDNDDEPQEENVSLLTHRSAEAVLCEKRNIKSITINNRNRSTINNESIIKRSLTPTLEPQRSSTRYSSDLRDSSGAGSGWDSHRVTRKTLRMTLGKDFSPRKSLRTLVMEKSVKRRTAVNPVEQEETGLNKSFKKVLEPSGVSINDDDIGLDMTTESDHEASRIRQERAEYNNWIQKIRQKNLEVARKIEETVKENLARRSKDNVIFKVPAVPIQRNKGETRKPRKPQKAKEKVFPAGLPPEFFADMKYKPPKRFAPRNAPWITKRLYKYLEDKLEPRYDYKARIRAEKLVMFIYEFTKIVRKYPVAAPVEDINRLKYEMAKLNIVKTHFDFNNFFEEFMPRGIRTKVIPDILNGLPLPRPDLFSEILLNNSSNR